MQTVAVKMRFYWKKTEKIGFVKFHWPSFQDKMNYKLFCQISHFQNVRLEMMDEKSIVRIPVFSNPPVVCGHIQN